MSLPNCGVKAPEGAAPLIAVPEIGLDDAAVVTTTTSCVLAILNTPNL
jgi:hypothetical protein